jgi:hypothetical protein
MNSDKWRMSWGKYRTIAEEGMENTEETAETDFVGDKG